MFAFVFIFIFFSVFTFENERGVVGLSTRSVENKQCLFKVNSGWFQYLKEETQNETGVIKYISSTDIANFEEAVKASELIQKQTVQHRRT